VCRRPLRSLLLLRYHEQNTDGRRRGPARQGLSRGTGGSRGPEQRLTCLPRGRHARGPQHLPPAATLAPPSNQQIDGLWGGGRNPRSPCRGSLHPPTPTGSRHGWVMPWWLAAWLPGRERVRPSVGPRARLGVSLVARASAQLLRWRNGRTSI
jgi:hypothetical protein